MKLYLFAIVLMLASFFLSPTGVQANFFETRACTARDRSKCYEGELCIGNKCASDGFPGHLIG